MNPRVLIFNFSQIYILIEMFADLEAQTLIKPKDVYIMNKLLWSLQCIKHDKNIKVIVSNKKLLQQPFIWFDIVFWLIIAFVVKVNKCFL